MAARVLDGKGLAQRLRGALAVRVAEFQSRSGIQPGLTAVLVGDDPASAVYVKNKEAACRQAGIAAAVERLPAGATEAELLTLISRLNATSAVHGILVQLPLPRQIRPQAALDAVSPLKDVDCFHAENVGLMVQGRPRFLPCTPAGVLAILADAQIPVAGAHAVVVGRSEIVGKPLALMLLQKGAQGNATVTVCHSQTRGLAEICRTADILIAAIGQPELITAEHIKPGAVVIDVGTNRVGARLTGDVCFAAAEPIASAITPVPGGVGPMTIAMLLENTLSAARLQTADGP